MPATTAVVKTGRAIIANRVLGSGTEPKYLAIGCGSSSGTTTAVTTDDTALGYEVETRATGTSSRVTTSGGSTNDTYQVVGTITAASNHNSTGTSSPISEIGLFDQSAVGGNLFVRGVLASTVSLASGDTITITATVQVTSSVV
jgi:hypothetical protein